VSGFLCTKRFSVTLASRITIKCRAWTDAVAMMLNWLKAFAVFIGALAMVAGAGISAAVYLDPHADVTKPFLVQVWQTILADYRASHPISQVRLSDTDSGEPAVAGAPNTPSKVNSYNAPLPSGVRTPANASPGPPPAQVKANGRTSRSLALLLHRQHLFDSRRRQ
jgi:hypothetical protein